MIVSNTTVRRIPILPQADGHPTNADYGHARKRYPALPPCVAPSAPTPPRARCSRALPCHGKVELYRSVY